MKKHVNSHYWDDKRDELQFSGKRYPTAPLSLQTCINRDLFRIQNLEYLMRKPLNDEHGRKLAKHYENAIAQLAYHATQLGSERESHDF